MLMVPAMQFLFGSLDSAFGHYRRYTKQSISKIARTAGFSIEKTEYVNIIGMLGWFLFGKIMKSKNLPQQLCGRFNLMIPLLKLERPIAYFFGLSVIAKEKTNLVGAGVPPPPSFADETSTPLTYDKSDTKIFRSAAATFNESIFPDIGIATRCGFELKTLAKCLCVAFSQIPTDLFRGDTFFGKHRLR